MQDSASIKNVPSLNDYYRKVHFGFAAGRLDLPPALIGECTDRRNFDAAELPYEYWSGLPSEVKTRLKKRFPVLHCGNFFASGLTELITGADKNLRNQFIRVCSGILCELAAEGIQYGALDFSLTQLLQDERRLEIVTGLLRKLHPVLLETGVTLLLPVRLPLPDPLLKEKITRFLRDEMIPNLKLRLEIYPHQLKPDFKPEDVAGTFRLETRSVLFCCNADTGNRIVRAHLTSWLRYFALNAFPGPYLFCPFSRENRLAAAESEALSKLTGEINKLQAD